MQQNPLGQILIKLCLNPTIHANDIKVTGYLFHVCGNKEQRVDPAEIRKALKIGTCAWSSVNKRLKEMGILKLVRSHKGSLLYYVPPLE